ncbi:hypothetical protein RUM44_005257 [Polyplax serrata]|uniref:Uncharacterized protein n=1 Tax=Polyplax serrata TaxID=468196 RepID=A0ABR1AEH5_POLSC
MRKDGLEERVQAELREGEIWEKRMKSKERKKERKRWVDGTGCRTGYGWKKGKRQRKGIRKGGSVGRWRQRKGAPEPRTWDKDELVSFENWESARHGVCNHAARPS